MNIKHLEHLLALADTGSFSRAAEKLFITQSALSRSIHSLEDDLGGKVLDRIGKRNELTPLGLDVVSRARHIVRDASELRHSAKLLKEGGRGAISVGLGSGPAALLMVPLMCAAASQPGMRVAVTQGPVELQIQQLRSRQIDAMVADGSISGGMLPKISGALDAAKSGVKAVHIIDGRIEHSLLLEVLTEQAFGTMIRSH